MACNVLRMKINVENKKQEISTFVTVDFSERYKLHFLGYAVLSSLFEHNIFNGNCNKMKYIIERNDIRYTHALLLKKPNNEFKYLPKYSLQDLELKIGDTINFQILNEKDLDINIELIDIFEMPKYTGSHYPYIEEINDENKLNYIESLIFSDKNKSFEEFMLKQIDLPKTDDDYYYRTGNLTFKDHISYVFNRDFNSWRNSGIKAIDVSTSTKAPKKKKEDKNKETVTKKELYTLLVTYDGLEEKVYRRIKLYSKTKLVEAGNSINYYFRTFCYHLFYFEKDGVMYDFPNDFGSFGKTKNICKYKISDILKSVGDTCEYLYDYGTSQEFTIKLEKIEYTTDPENIDIDFYPAVIDGAGRGIVDDMSQNEFIEKYELAETSNKDFFYIYCEEGKKPSKKPENIWYIDNFDIDDLKDNAKSSLKSINKNYKELCE